MEYTIEVLEANVRCLELIVISTNDSQLKTLCVIRIKDTKELLESLKEAA